MTTYRIKPLAWKDHETKAGWYSVADTPMGEMCISPRASNLDYQWDCWGCEAGGIEPTIETAKYAAEAWYREKMGEGLEPVEVTT